MAEHCAALLVGGTVLAVVVVDDGVSWEPPAGHSIVVLEPGSPAGVGWTYDGANWSPPDSDGSDPELSVEEQLLQMQTQLVDQQSMIDALIDVLLGGM